MFLPSVWTFRGKRRPNGTGFETCQQFYGAGDAVIIFGDFGIPPGHRLSGAFWTAAGWEVKNDLFLLLRNVIFRRPGM